MPTRFTKTEAGMPEGIVEPARERKRAASMRLFAFDDSKRSLYVPAETYVRAMVNKSNTQPDWHSEQQR